MKEGESREVFLCSHYLARHARIDRARDRERERGGAAIVKATEVVSLDKRAPLARAPNAEEVGRPG